MNDAGSRFRSTFFGTLFIVYTLFVAACILIVFYDPPWVRGSNIGSGMIGLLAMFAAGFPWNLVLLSIFGGCSQILGVCNNIITNDTVGFVVLGSGFIPNLWFLGACAGWWSFTPWRFMLKNEPKFEISALSQSISRGGHTVDVHICRFKGEAEWILEIYDEYGNSTTWDETFHSDSAAFVEAKKRILEEGIFSLVGPENDKD